MAEYTGAIDDYISRTLQARGHVSASMFPGVDDDDAMAFLRRYSSLHGHEGRDLRFERDKLVCALDVTATSPGLDGPPISPVDQVMAAPQGRALLDVSPTSANGPYPKWMWWLPLALGFVGGVIGWLLVRENNRSAARAMLAVGVVVTFGSIIVGLGMASAVGGTGSGPVAWPASPDGRVAFYYFGTST